MQQADDHLTIDQLQAQHTDQATSAHSREQAILDQILSQQEFDQAKQPSLWDRVMDKLSDWLNRHLTGIASLSRQSKWIARTFVWAVILLPCGLLAWWLVQQERRLRSLSLRTSASGSLSPDSPSARDWQAWLEDAKRFAGNGQWRDALHHLYWAAISRLESGRVWPADRARTPREYLQLLAADDPRRGDLTALTRQFEGAWYGFGAVSEPDYRVAIERVERLAR